MEKSGAAEREKTGRDEGMRGCTPQAATAATDRSFPREIGSILASQK